jgi:hypothetical protein
MVVRNVSEERWPGDIRSLDVTTIETTIGRNTPVGVDLRDCKFAQCKFVDRYQRFGGNTRSIFRAGDGGSTPAPVLATGPNVCGFEPGQGD